MVRIPCLVLGVTLIGSGGSLGIPLPQTIQGNAIAVLSLGENLFPKDILYGSVSSVIHSISSGDPQNSGAPSLENKKPGDSNKSPQKDSASPQKNPAVLVPEIPDQNNGEAVVTYKSKIEETQNLLRTIDESQLTNEQHDTFISIQSFLKKAQEAFAQDDMSMAVNLVEKAHTLTKEIVKNSAPH